MSLPIETGCKAIVIGSKYNDGKIVTVGEYIGTIGHLKDLWLVDVIIEYYAPKANRGRNVRHISGKLLRRIDDDQDDIISWEDMEGLWVPDEVKVPVLIDS